MIDSTSYEAPDLVWDTPDATIVLGQDKPSLPCGRSRRPARPILRPASTHPVDSTIALRDLHALHAYALDRAVAGVGLDRLDRVDHVHAARYLPERRVLAVQPRRRRCRHDEELAAVRVRPCVGHGQCAPHDRVVVDLVVELVAGAAGADALRATALNHEIRDHAVEDQPVVEALSGQLGE